MAFGRSNSLSINTGASNSLLYVHPIVAHPYSVLFSPCLHLLSSLCVSKCAVLPLRLSLPVPIVMKQFAKMNPPRRNAIILPPGGLTMTFPSGNTQSNASQPQQAGSLFGGAAATSQPQQSTPLFGSAATPSQTQQPNSLFGGAASTATSQPQQSGSLFGNAGAASQPQQTNSLFGNAGATSPPQQTGSLFGGPLGQTQNQTQTQAPTNSMFGATSQNNNQNQNQQPGGSLFGGFGGQTKPAAGSLL